jgi:hypothetical protein
MREFAFNIPTICLHVVDCKSFIVFSLCAYSVMKSLYSAVSKSPFSLLCCALCSMGALESQTIRRSDLYRFVRSFVPAPLLLCVIDIHLFCYFVAIVVPLD